jgi:hypothetical protein
VQLAAGLALLNVRAKIFYEEFNAQRLWDAVNFTTPALSIDSVPDLSALVEVRL